MAKGKQCFHARIDADLRTPLQSALLKAMSKTPDLQSAYALETPDDNRALYRDWAATYDSAFVDASGYVLHMHVARAFHAAGGKGQILDIGAGTGIVGVVLKSLGYDDVHATDISPEMLNVAKEKGVYSNLFASDILQGLKVADNSYAGIVSAGTFTLGHVGPSALNEVIRLLTPGGLAVISVRDAHWHAEDFAGMVASLEPKLADWSTTQVPIYQNSPDPGHAKDRALLLHLTKR